MSQKEKTIDQLIIEADQATKSMNRQLAKEEELTARIKKLMRERDKIKNKANQEARKADTHQKVVIGALVIKYCTDKGKTRIDKDKFEQYLQQYGTRIANLCCVPIGQAEAEADTSAPETEATETEATETEATQSYTTPEVSTTPDRYYS